MFDIQKLALILEKKTDLSVRASELYLMQGAGFNHDHIVLGDTGWLARLPRGNNLNGLSSKAYIEFQAAVYETSSVSGHSPKLEAALLPEDGLPHGALIVQHIQGAVKADFSKDYFKIAIALAAIHTTVPPQLMPHAEEIGTSQRDYIEAMVIPSLSKAALRPDAYQLIEHALQEVKIILSVVAQQNKKFIQDFHRERYTSWKFFN